MTAKSVLFLSGLVLLIFISFPAAADSIDGRWCHKGSQVTIESPMIITPSGKKVAGEFDRHSFSYTIPSGDKYAGEKGEYVVHDGTYFFANLKHQSPDTFSESIDDFGNAWTKIEQNKIPHHQQTEIFLK